MDGVDHTYYLAALGDEVIACIEEITETDQTGGLDEETIAGLNEFYAQSAEQTPGICMGVYKSGDRVSTCAGIDFQTTDQNALVAGGMVSGEYQDNMADGWLGLFSGQLLEMISARADFCSAWKPL